MKAFWKWLVDRLPGAAARRAKERALHYGKDSGFGQF
jgi:hypothetical protein